MTNQCCEQKKQNYFLSIVRIGTLTVVWAIDCNLKLGSLNYCAIRQAQKEEIGSQTRGINIEMSKSWSNAWDKNKGMTVSS